MKIVVLNYSGNVGKSTISQTLLAPRIPAPVYAVETINSDGTDTHGIKGKEFAQLHEELLAESAAVVDVGSSNVEPALMEMRKYPGWADDYDYFVVPVTPVKKQQRDTISTIEGLSQLGVPASKIRLVFNMVESDDNPESVFGPIFEFAKTGQFVLNTACVIRVNEVYARAAAAGTRVLDLASDETDYKAILAESKSQREKLKASMGLQNHRLAIGVTRDLDLVFAALFAPV
jgi:MinD-like ATPase involved in chromosome partitioning or flagellar assembly